MVTYPKDWNETKLLDCVRLVQGLTYTPERVKPYGTLVLRSSNIQNNRLSLLDNVYVDMLVPQDKMIEAGDILVCVRNGSAALIGKSCVLQALPNTTFGAFMSVLRGDTTGFIAKLVESDIVQNQVKDRSNATINQITKKDFESVSVTVPDKPEQSEIAKVLLEIDSSIDNLTELIEKKKGIRDGALEDLVSGRTRLKGYRGEWDIRCIGECAYIYSGGTPKTTNPYFWNGDVVWLTPGEITNNKGLYIHTSERKITVDGVNNSSATILPKGTILLCTRATIGYLAIADTELATNQGFKNLVCKPDIDNVFFVYALMTKKSEMVTKAIGTTFLEISKKALSSIEMRIPLLPEQQAISSVLTAMDEEILSLEEEKDKMLQIKAGAMDDLLTGRIRLTRQGG
jgi:type I restriction enzyme S subunit